MIYTGIQGTNGGLRGAGSAPAPPSEAGPGLLRGTPGTQGHTGTHEEGTERRHGRLPRLGSEGCGRDGDVGRRRRKRKEEEEEEGKHWEVSGYI